MTTNRSSYHYFETVGIFRNSILSFISGRFPPSAARPLINYTLLRSFHLSIYPSVTISLCPGRLVIIYLSIYLSIAGSPLSALYTTRREWASKKKTRQLLHVYLTLHADWGSNRWNQPSTNQPSSLRNWLTTWKGYTPLFVLSSCISIVFSFILT